MQTADFAENMPGRLIHNLDGHLAFVPNVLPPQVHWTTELMGILSAADRALGQLAGLGRSGGVNPHLLIRPFVRREAVLSSQIEGTQASLSDLLLFEQAASVEQRVPDVREVANYVHALELGLDSLRHRPLSAALIRDLHQVLMSNVRGGDKTPGAFRRKQVFIGATANIAEARFVPPPFTEVDASMTSLEQYIQTPSPLPALVRLAMVHYQFETIHPFEDGNGRIGRLLITLMLCADGLLPLPLLYLSAYFERNRQEYYRRLLGVSQKGEWEEWFRFFAAGVASQATDAVERYEHLMQLRRRYHQQFQTARGSALMVRLIDGLFERPAITTASACELLHVTPASAQAHINRLVEAGVLAEATGQKRNRVYLAKGILNVLDREDLGPLPPDEGKP